MEEMHYFIPQDLKTSDFISLKYRSMNFKVLLLIFSIYKIKGSNLSPCDFHECETYGIRSVYFTEV